MNDSSLGSRQSQGSWTIATLALALMVVLMSWTPVRYSSAAEPADACALPLLRSIFLQKLPLQQPQERTFRLDMTSLIRGYGAYLTDLEFSDGKIYLVTKNDTRIMCDDRKQKNFEQKRQDPDLKDMLALLYSPGKIVASIAENHDPGRFRVLPLLESVYRACEKR